ncbi:tetratricopeptide repeat protein [Bacillus cereus group sp. MYBK65-1]|uniref:response regulator aspartate phosphatase n=1 Tax=unclassified Bacillus cereus group TaxID=2750818 RepID=UPI002A58E9C9|nr:tetratricopeptide repeat protein [Bacillus cereus]
MDTLVTEYEVVANMLNDWYIEIRARRIDNAHQLKEEIDNRMKEVSDQSLHLYYSLLDFRYKYIVDNLNISKECFDKVESFQIPNDNILTYYYHFFKAIHASTVGSYSIARDHYDKAEELLHEVSDEIEQAEFYYKIGAFHYDIYESLQSIKYVNKAKETFSKHEGHERNIGFCENLLGMACTNLREWALAEEHLVKAMDLFQKIGEEKFTVMVRHNLGLLYAGQNMSELAIRYLSEVSEKKPNHYKAIFIEGREHSKLRNKETANTLFERGLQLCTELNNEEYQHRFKILRDINNNVPAEKLEATVLAGIEYFEREDLYEYIYECCNVLAEKIFEQGQHAKAGTYFYKAMQAKKKADAKGALK